MITDLIYKSLTTRIAPMVYIMMFVSVIVGFFFMTGINMNENESILYGTGVLVHKSLWGAFLFTTATTAFVGMVLNKEWMMQAGGIAGFTAWGFACFTLVLAEHWYVLFTFALFHLLFHGYVYLATTTRTIFRRTELY